MESSQEDPRKRLSNEIWRIISSPYPVSLKTLQDILSHDQDGNALADYALSNPCKITRLVGCVLDHLECRPVAADLLRYLCQCALFRQQLLQRRPEVLNAFLAKASSGDKPYTVLCLQILRQPLPENLPLPASVETFFIGVITEAIHGPEKRTLLAAYDLLFGACNHLPQLLQPNDWTILESELIRIVKSSRTIQDQSLSLLCLGILHTLSQQHMASISSDVSEAGAFFRGTKALKSLSLATLQAAWVTKPTHEAPRSEVLRSLIIASSVIGSIPSSLVETWIKSPEGQGAFSRLVAQLQDPKIHIDIRTKLLSLSARLCLSTAVPTRLLSSLTGFIANGEYFAASPAVFVQAFETILPLLVLPSNTTALTELVKVVARSVPQSCPELVNRRHILSLLSSTIQANADLSKHFQVIFDVQTTNNVRLPDHETITCDGDTDCQATLSTARHSFTEDLAVLSLMTLITSLNTDHNRVRTSNAMDMLRTLRTTRGQITCGCETSDTTFKADLSLIEQPCSNPQAQHQSWKELLHAFVVQQSASTEHRLVDVVGRICADLEERCENAEKPFRDAAAEAETLRLRLAEVEHRNRELGQEIVDLNLRHHTVEAEKKEIEDTLQSENERLVVRVSNLERDLKERNDAAAQQINVLEAEYQARELELRTVLTDKDMALVEATSRVEQFQQLRSSAEDKLKSVNIELARRAVDQEELQEKLYARSKELNDVSRANSALENEILRLTNLQHDTANSLSRAQHDLEDTHRHAQELIVSHESAVMELESHIKQDKADHIMVVDQMQQSFAAEKQSILDDKEALQKTLESEKVAKKALQEQVSQLHVDLEDRRTEIEQMQESLATRDGEITKLRVIKQTVAMAIGHMSDPRDSWGVTKSAGPARKSKRITDNNTVVEHRIDHESEMQDVASIQPSNNTHFESNSTDEGSTPKRVKHRTHFRVPVSRQPRLNAITPKSVRIRSPRLPLKDVSADRGNRSPIKQVAATKEGKLAAGYSNINVDGVAEFDDMEFGSEIFTSTPFTPARQDAHGFPEDDETLDD